MGDGTHEGGTSEQRGQRVRVTLRARPDRKLIEPAGSVRHVDVHLQVSRQAGDANCERAPLLLALVLDRSGSMAGEKLSMAKRAALAVLDKLDERDRVALVVFDDHIDVLQPAALATDVVKAHARAELARIESRGSTALHEGWLTGCNAIVEELARDGRNGVARCFLLTDGLANVGISDPEQIARQAGDIRLRTGIGTSTFGVGADYNEALLGPMAEAGGGEFYHLRNAHETTGTFIGELGEMLGVAAGNARLEIEAQADVRVEALSAYRMLPADGTRRVLLIGDLLAGDERHIVVRCTLPGSGNEAACPVRARLVWTEDGAEQQTEWQVVPFQYATHAACQDETADEEVLHWVRLDQTESAWREALRQNASGDWQGAQATLRAASAAIAAHAETDQELQARLAELLQMESELDRGLLDAMRAKEAYYQSQTRSRGKAWRDYRGPTKP
jgi:Ca-activated chloride channel family protein